MLDALRQQVGPDSPIIPLGSMRYRPSAVVVSGFIYPLELVSRALADPETGHADLAAPSVLVYDGLLANDAQLRHGLVPVLEHIVGGATRRALAVLAFDLDGVLLDALISSHQRKVCSIAAIGCAGMEREEARHYLYAAARACGAAVLGRTGPEGQPQTWPAALGSAGRILTDRRRTIILDPAHADRAGWPAQSIGLLSVGGNDARDVLEGVEWIEGLLGH